MRFVLLDSSEHNMENPVIFAMSALSLTVLPAIVYFAIYFMILYTIFWGVLLVFRSIKNTLDVSL